MFIKEAKLRQLIKSVISETFRPGPGGLGANQATVATMTNDFKDIPYATPQDIAHEFDITDPVIQEELMNHWRTINPGRPFPSSGENITYQNNVNGFTNTYIYNANIQAWEDEEDLNEELIDTDKMF